MNTEPPPIDNTPEDNQSSNLQQRGCPPPSPEENRRRWAQWHQAMELSHAMLLMGLRQRIGPEGDLPAAYRQWYHQYQALKWESHRAP